MNKLKKYFIKYSYGAFLGASLGLVGCHVTDWQFWVILIPTIALAEMKVFHTNEDEKEG